MDDTRVAGGSSSSFVTPFRQETDGLNEADKHHIVQHFLWRVEAASRYAQLHPSAYPQSLPPPGFAVGHTQGATMVGSPVVPWVRPVSRRTRAVRPAFVPPPSMPVVYYSYPGVPAVWPYSYHTQRDRGPGRGQQ